MIGHVTLSFVPVLAALIVFGLWPAIVVAAASGLATVTVTRDPQKVAFNVGDYVVSTFLAGLVYLAFVPAHPAFVQTVLPAFAATGADFVVNTVVLAGVARPGERRQAVAHLARELPVGPAELHDRRDPQPAAGLALPVARRARPRARRAAPVSHLVLLRRLRRPPARPRDLLERGRPRFARSSPPRSARRTSCATPSAAWRPRSSGPAAFRPTCCRDRPPTCRASSWPTASSS